jgi:phosphoribosylanthranilate isomerase
MLITKVKICGITNHEDAVAVMDMGADLLGFNFYSKSPRFIQPERAAEMISKLPASVDVVGVFVNASLEHIRRIVDLCQLGWVQLHGDEEPNFCEEFASDSIRTIKALRIKDVEDMQRMDDYFTDAVLLDAFDPARYGGTGRRFDWTTMVVHTYRRVFLAGGVNPDNAAEAAGLGVYGIDVCSGVEAEPGRKDHKKLKKLFDNIRHLRA